MVERPRRHGAAGTAPVGCAPGGTARAGRAPVPILVGMLPSLVAALLLAAPVDCPPGTTLKGGAPPDLFEAWCEGRPDAYGKLRRHGPSRTSRRAYSPTSEPDPDGAANPRKVLPRGSRCGDLQRVPDGAWI